MSAGVDEWMSGCMDGWTDGWMDAWIGRRTNDCFEERRKGQLPTPLAPGPVAPADSQLRGVWQPARVPRSASA
eukprot:226019-Chlamydomonas_euryale.AAC.3